MRSWLILLSGLLIWAIHFFALYAIGEFAGSGTPARAGVIAITLACLAANAAILLYIRVGREAFDRWRTNIAAGSLLLSLIGVFWQALPALF